MAELYTDPSTGGTYDITTGDLLGTAVDSNGDPIGGGGGGASMTANTGRNDSNSVFGSGLVGDIRTLTGGASDILTALNSGNKKPAAKASKLPSWIPIAAVGAVVLVLGIALIGRK